MRTNEQIIEKVKNTITEIAPSYHIKMAYLFGSRASGKNRNDSDVDLLVEFFEPISLFTIASIKSDIEEACGLSADVIHAPLNKNSLIEVDKQVKLYG